MPTNSAAYLTAPYADLTVADAPYTSAGAGELVIRARAVAVNPLDEIKQSTGNVMYGWLPSPAVLGEDVAGEVVEVGAGVSGFTVGDRVIAYAVGMEKNRNHAAEGAFQLFSVVQAQLTARIPDELSFESAVVLPLAISTAASALFQNDQLGLRHPTSGVVAAQADALNPFALTVILLITFALVYACSVVKKSWALPFIVGLQVAIVACWLIHPAIGIMGLVFGLVWWTLIYFRTEYRRRVADGSLPQN